MMAGKHHKPYVKLPGRGVRGRIASATYTSLWMGADHLMQVVGTRFSEDYKRFYFKDIKAIIIRRTRAWATTSWILLGIAVLFMGIFGALAANAGRSDREGFLITGGCIAGFFLFIAAINLLLGPTCVCHLRTPVQEEELPSLKRLRTARKALQRIRVAVEAVQGPLAENRRQEIASLIARYEGLPVDAIPRHTTQVPPLLPNASSTSLRWNIALIVALLVCSTMELLLVPGMRNMVIWFFNVIANLAIGGVSIAMLARLPQGVGKSAGWTRVAIWGGWFGVRSVYGFIMTFRYSMEHPGQNADIVKIMQILPQSYYSVMAIAAAMYFIWAILEIIVLARAKKQLAPQPSTAEVIASTDRY